MRTTAFPLALFAVLLAAGWERAQAAPQIDAGTTVTRKKGMPHAAISYSLSGEPAVVTIDVLVGGVSAGAAARLCVTGDVNRLVQPGVHKAVLQTTGPLASVADKDVSVAVRAWATNCPPDYLVLSLTNRNEAARYYLTADDVPGGVSHARYKTSHLVMRKIPAANAEWRMGSPEMEVGRSGRLGGDGTVYGNFEKAHYVRLTEDFYLGVYPVTYRQHVHAVGSFSFGMWQHPAYADYRTDDMPLAPAQFVSLRSWMHDNAKGCDANCSAHIKYWPRDGREIDAAGSPKCERSGGTYTPYLRAWRDSTGFEFDLPTDAQWEFACRGGATAYESRYGELDDIAWYLFNSSNATHNCCVPHPVGLKKPNGYGLCDMTGNILELCLDFYADAENSGVAAVDPPGPTAPINDRNARRVSRGGTFDSPAELCRSAARKGISCASVHNDSFSGDTSGTLCKNSNGFRLWLPAHAEK